MPLLIILYLQLQKAFLMEGADLTSISRIILVMKTVVHPRMSLERNAKLIEMPDLE
jgi:hypothetical protein